MPCHSSFENSLSCYFSLLRFHARLMEIKDFWLSSHRNSTSGQKHSQPLEVNTTRSLVGENSLRRDKFSIAWPKGEGEDIMAKRTSERPKSPGEDEERGLSGEGECRQWRSRFFRSWTESCCGIFTPLAPVSSTLRSFRLLSSLLHRN